MELKTVTEDLVKDDLLFHFVHGLCRVAAVTRPVPSAEVSYYLLPVARSQAKVCFTVPLSSLENSGFSKLMTAREARAILEYLKTGIKKNPPCSQAWMRATLLCAESCSKDSLRDARKRQRLEQTVRGLTGELAFVLKCTLTEIVKKIRKNLGLISQVNPLVLTVLTNIDKES